jgi:hypothetical protein
MHKQAMAAAVVWYEADGTNGQFFHNLGCWQGQDFAGGFWLTHNCLFIESPRNVEDRLLVATIKREGYQPGDV